MPFLRRLGFLIMGIPGTAHAANGDTLDLSGGTVGALTLKTLAIAHGFLAFLLVLSVVLELLRGPVRRKQYLAVVWRTLVVLGLLQAYTFLAGSAVKLCTSLAQVLATEEASAASLQQYQASVVQLFAAADVSASQSNADARAGRSATHPPVDEFKPAGGVGGYLFDAVIAVLLLLAEAIHWVFTELSRILIAFLYSIGPLALVLYVPGFDTPIRWLRSLITVSCWPLVSAVLLNLSTSALNRTTADQSGAGAAFAALASSLLLCSLAFATPKIASVLVGGAGNLIAEGARAALKVASGAGAVGAL